MQPVAIDFPLRGEWTAVNTPAHRVPSHGTNSLAQTYAFDFVRLGWADGKARQFHRKSQTAYWLGQVGLQDCYGWGEPIFSPFDGVVVEAADGWPERKTVHLVRDLAVAVSNGLFFKAAKAGDLRPVAGNHLIIEGPECWAFVAHARPGSVRVKAGERVAVGQVLAEIGHSGNSTAPHLHFHLMDGPEVRSACGLPCRFRHYEVFKRERWEAVQGGVPGRLERIRAPEHCIKLEPTG